MNKDATKFYSNKQEKMIADLLGWTVVSGSGAAAGHPGDITCDDWLGECKTHISPGKQNVFYSDVWTKIVEEATSKFKYPVLFVDDGSQTSYNTWCAFLYKSVAPADSIIVPYPFKLSKNISFSSKKLGDIMLSENSQQNVIFATKLGKYDVGITSLFSFSTMFGEYK